MAKKTSDSRFMRIFVAIIGCGFILWAIGLLWLGFSGDKAQARITNIRREGGERNETIRGRYTYIVSYSFKLPNGRQVDGYVRKISDSVYLKADGNSLITVRYFSFMPFVNSPEAETSPGLKHLVYLAVGFLLIYFPYREKRLKSASRKQINKTR